MSEELREANRGEKVEKVLTKKKFGESRSVKGIIKISSSLPTQT